MQLTLEILPARSRWYMELVYLPMHGKSNSWDSRLFFAKAPTCSGPSRICYKCISPLLHWLGQQLSMKMIINCIEIERRRAICDQSTSLQMSAKVCRTWKPLSAQTGPSFLTLTSSAMNSAWFVLIESLQCLWKGGLRARESSGTGRCLGGNISQMENPLKTCHTTKGPACSRVGLRTPTDETKMLQSGRVFVIQKLSRKADFVTKQFEQR